MASQRDTLSEKLDRVQKSIQQFPAVASSLNTATDQLGKSIGQLDAVLKKFSLGIPTWVTFTPPNELHFPQYYHEDIGYAKIGGKWGIAIRTVSGHEASDLADVEQWLFPEAPRLLRVQAIDWIPELLEALLKSAGDMSKKIAEKAGEVDFLAAGISSVIDQQSKAKEIQGGFAQAISLADEAARAAAVLSDPAYSATIEELSRASAISPMLGLDTSLIPSAASVMSVAEAIAGANESLFERVTGLPKSLAGAKPRK